MKFSQNNMVKTMQNLSLKFKLFRSSGFLVKNAKELYFYKIDIYTKSTKNFKATFKRFIWERLLMCPIEMS